MEEEAETFENLIVTIKLTFGDLVAIKIELTFENLYQRLEDAKKASALRVNIFKSLFAPKFTR